MKQLTERRRSWIQPFLGVKNYVGGSTGERFEITLERPETLGEREF